MKKVCLTSLLLCIVFFSCTNRIPTKQTTNNSKADTAKVPEAKGLEKKYLSNTELRNYADSAKLITPTSKYSYPFDSFTFNKVIAYDFDGREERNTSVVDKDLLGYSYVITKQQELTSNQVNFLIEKLTANSSYGEVVAACFEPHMGIVFYQDKKKKFVIDICMDCNFLKSTVTIPATHYKKRTFDDGSSYPLKGFSKSGKESIIQLAKELGLDYADFEMRE